MSTQHTESSSNRRSSEASSINAAQNLPDEWRTKIIRLVNEAVGQAEIFVIGSRALGTATAQSDCDVSVLLPLRKVIVAAGPLQHAASRLTSEFGVAVSVNP